MEVWIEIVVMGDIRYIDRVTSLVEVWIEMVNSFLYSSSIDVTSLVEVWIEIYRPRCNITGILSLPLWKCGLKSSAIVTMSRALCHFPCGSVD